MLVKVSFKREFKKHLAVKFVVEISQSLLSACWVCWYHWFWSTNYFNNNTQASTLWLHKLPQQLESICPVILWLWWWIPSPLCCCCLPSLPKSSHTSSAAGGSDQSAPHCWLLMRCFPLLFSSTATLKSSYITVKVPEVSDWVGASFRYGLVLSAAIRSLVLDPGTVFFPSSLSQHSLFYYK